MIRTNYRGAVACLSLAGLLGGCAGVPNFYGSTFNRKEVADKDHHYPSNPKVNDIVRHISCELAKAATTYPQIKSDNYFIKVFLTLEGDDNLDLTPSLGFIDPFKTSGQSVTTTISGDLGGARQRTFTATYTLEGSKLADAAWCPHDENGILVADGKPVPPGQPKFDVDQRKTYRLNGNLGLAEIIDDGLEIIHDKYDTNADPGYDALHKVVKPADQAAPTFGSKVQFTINRQLSGLGPVWTITRFKGPSGANGLINGKRQDIDSVIFTFSPELTGGAKATTAAQVEAEKTAKAKAAAVASRTAKIKAKRRDLATKQAGLHTLQSQRARLRSLLEMRAIDPKIALQRQSVQQAGSSLAAAQAKLPAEQQEATNAARSAETLRSQSSDLQQNSDVNAALATNNLLTSMLLQGIAGAQPR